MNPFFRLHDEPVRRLGTASQSLWIRRVSMLGMLALAIAPMVAAQDHQAACPAGTLWEPYTEVCAEVRDLRHLFLLQLTIPAGGEAVSKGRTTSGGEIDWPVPGSMAAGTTYDPNQLRALESGRLYTKMFVHPDGLPTAASLPNILYTTATSRVHMGLELLGAYRGGGPGSTALLGLFAWTCLPGYPCPNGATAPGFQWWMDFTNLSCNVSHVVDPGGHAHRFLYYTNQSDKLSDGDPPDWKSAVYLWNYCDSSWDLAWEHTYRADKIDCSVPGAGCAWWGPSIEIFGDAPYPQMAELGYQDSLLYHDGLWSELRPPEANFRDPIIWAPTTPWQLFHLDPNRSYGVGNWFDQNDPPTIDGQEQLATLEDQSVIISAQSLVISDPDVDVRFHVAFSIRLFPGENYLHDGLKITPTENFNGQLNVPVTVSDGAADSQTFELQIDVTPVNDPPVIVGQKSLQTPERTPLTITAQDLQLTDPDDEVGNLEIAVQDGVGYQRVDNTITPEPGVVGDLRVGVISSDGDLQSAVFPMLVVVAPDSTPPELTLLGQPTVTLQVGDAYTDAGATARDDLDGDVTAQIVTDNPVDTSRTGTYVVTYSVSDLSGNHASVTRTVIVQSAVVTPDVTPPVLTLRGLPTVTLRVGDVYTDAGASAVDNVDGDITARIVTVNPVDTSLAGTYVVTYSVSDLGGNSAAITRTVIVNSRPRHNGGGRLDVGFALLLLVMTGMRRHTAGNNRKSPVT